MNYSDTPSARGEPVLGDPMELPSGRLAGIDFGTRRVGIAISDPRQAIASPHGQLHRGSPASDAAYFQELVRTEQIVGFVVGLPLHMSGDESDKSRQARTFGAWLASVTGLSVIFHDERYSTAFADQLLADGGLTPKQRRARRDMLAAQLILDSYLERGRKDT